MLILGRAEWYRMKMTLMPIPIRIPNSKGRTRHAIKAARPGIKSISVGLLFNEDQLGLMYDQIYINSASSYSLLLRHMGLTTFTSTMNTTAAIMMAPSAALGM